MYSTCLFCHGALGTNDRVAHFPVGRRLAFDPEKGRLWVVCPSCTQWNLTPLEERWEAIEECEKLYRDTARRFGTSEIGIARIPESLDLIRIGRPLRPEYAAWRYGESLIRRSRRARVKGAVGATGVVGALGAAVLGGVPILGIGVVVGVVGWYSLLGSALGVHRAISPTSLGRLLYTIGVEPTAIERVPS